MADIKSRADRSKNMSRIRGKDTKPEMLVRRALYSRGFRYRLYGSRDIGSPDLVFKGKKAVVFIHGCFWHQHTGCKNAAIVKDDTDDKWALKLKANVDRDKKNKARALETGFAVATIWECALQPKKKQSIIRQQSIDRLIDWLNRDGREISFEICIE